MSVDKKTCYIYYRGQLCNQLFETAAAYAHAKRHVLTLRVSPQTQGNSWNTYMHKFADKRGAPIDGPIWREPHFHYAPIPAEVRVLTGYFQSSKYFNDVSGEIRELFQPPSKFQEVVRSIHTDILTPEIVERSVVVHVRRGDYVTTANKPIHGILDADYYARAIAAARAAVPDCRLLVFSDDLNWCKQQPCFAGATFVSEPNGAAALWLMSQFRNYVMSNSTFSWWAVWLGPQPKGWVGVPDRWFGPAGSQDWQDIYEEGWIKIPVRARRQT